MYFVNRIELGRSMAKKVAHLRAKEPIIVCLNEGSLSTSIGLASELRGWIYPLLSEPIIIPGDNRIIGVINQDGELCENPGLSRFEQEELRMDYSGFIQEASRQAFSKLNARLNSYGNLSKSGLKGHPIIICADIVRDQVEIAAAIEFLKVIDTSTIVSVAGNITIEAANTLTQTSQKSSFMDIMSNMFDDDHYFEEQDAYTLEEKKQLAMNISQYWI
jgi:predicted phosphoribosyltransferase